MMPWTRLLPIALIGLGLSFSASSKERSSSRLRIDSVNLSPEIQALLRSDLARLSTLDVQAPPGSPYFQVFQGTRSSDLMRYLEERIGYLAAEPDQEVGGETFAQNYAPSVLTYWYERHFLQDSSARPESARFENGTVLVSTPRVGFVTVGPAYVAPETDQIARMDTLLHEARHSDCAQMPTRRDLRAYHEDRLADVSNEGRACTHLHAPCPEGEGLVAGDLACDEHAWGAYSIGYAFSNGLFRWCTNCSEPEKQQALAVSVDGLSRLSPELQRGLVAGTLPTPVMRSLLR